MALGNGVVANLCDERRTAWTLDVAHKAGLCSRDQFDESMTTFSFCYKEKELASTEDNYKTSTYC